MSSVAAPCECLPWDSEFFSFPIARVSQETLDDDLAVLVDQWAQSNQIRCLYFLARADDGSTRRIAQRHGFELVDIRMTLQRDACHSSLGCVQHPASAKVSIRPAGPGDLPGLQRLAREAHRETRFFCDPGFPRQRCEDLYSTWITRECQGRARRVFVAALPDEQPVGYVSCHLEPGKAGQIGLVGVEDRFRGNGIGTSMISAALGWFADERALQVGVVTQGTNVPSQCLYQRCGFQTRQVQLWYHKWYPVAASGLGMQFTASR